MIFKICDIDNDGVMSDEGKRGGLTILRKLIIGFVFVVATKDQLYKRPTLKNRNARKSKAANGLPLYLYLS